MKKNLIPILMLVVLLAYSCKKDDDKSKENDIISFSFAQQADTATIDKAGKKILVDVKEGTDLSALKPVITVSKGATVDPSSGSTVNFTVSPVKFLVTAEDGTTQEWFVSVNIKRENLILSFSLSEQADTATIDVTGRQIIIKVKEGSDLTVLKPVITLAPGATITPASGSTVDFTNGPVKFVVTAADGITQEWLVTVNIKIENTIVPNLNSREITSILVDASNTQWIGTDSGLYKSVANGYEKQDIPQKVLSLYLEKSSSTLWIGTSAGLFKGSLSDSKLSISQVLSSNLSNSTIMSALVDSTSKRWFGSAQGLTLNKANSWKKENFIHNSLGAYVPMEIETASITAIAVGNGNYYFATTGYGLYRAVGYDESVDAFSGATSWASPYNGEAATDSIFATIIDSKGNLWFGSTNGIQKHINHNDPKMDNDSYLTELPNPRVHAIAEAPNGNIYAGTEKGIAVFNGTTWSKLSVNYYVTALAFLSDGSVLVGTKKGLNVIK